MKVFQIKNNLCRWHAREYETAAEAATHFAPNIVFVDAPDYVFECWGYDPMGEGDGRFVQPTPPEGWLYDVATGTFYREGDDPPEVVPTYDELRAYYDSVSAAVEEDTTTTVQSEVTE